MGLKLALRVKPGVGIICSSISSACALPKSRLCSPEPEPGPEWYFLVAHLHYMTPQYSVLSIKVPILY